MIEGCSPVVLSFSYLSKIATRRFAKNELQLDDEVADKLYQFSNGEFSLIQKLSRLHLNESNYKEALEVYKIDRTLEILKDLESHRHKAILLDVYNALMESKKCVADEEYVEFKEHPDLWCVRRCVIFDAQIGGIRLVDPVFLEVLKWILKDKLPSSVQKT